jgi:tRNA (guanine-N7-)-methyltransferase
VTATSPDEPLADRPRKKRGGRKKRVRHHVNPLGFIREVALPDWRELFAPGRPMEVDVGCATGEFLLGRAAQTPAHDIVGLEIRVPVVDQVQRRIARAGLTNAACVLCNANASFEALFAPASLRVVYVHFPDPWFKPRHHKRRLVTPAFVDLVASRLEVGGELEFMTDFGEYAAEVVPMVERHPAFVNATSPGAAAPFPEGRVLSHRETWHLGKGDRVHRYVWRRAR